jgi:ComF family protein
MDLQVLDGPVCRRCGCPDPGRLRDSCPECRGRDFAFQSARAAFRYDGAARSIVHRLKYSGQRRLADFMAAISADYLRRLTLADTSFTLTHVPQHRSRQASRGYNQAALYAGALSRRLGLPLRDLLAKKRATPAQNRLDFDSRRNNLNGSIIMKPRGLAAHRLAGSVILVDDVYTTGSTAAECAGILKDGLGVQIYIWTFARTVRNLEAAARL